jgi:hypothetical protein
VANDMEGVLADVDAGDRDTGMSCASGHWAGAPIAAAPLSSIIRWWGGEHGRTIPLPDIARLGASRCSNRFSAGVRHLILWHPIGGRRVRRREFITFLGSATACPQYVEGYAELL